MNVILLTIDCLRADHVGCLGYPRPTTPNMDNLAKKHGIVFSQAMANGPKTLASFPSILASAYPLMLGSAYRLPQKQPTIAEVLRGAGYTTVAYHSNPYLCKEYGYDRGFELLEDTVKDMSKVAVAGRAARRIIPKNSLLYRFLRRANRFLNVRSLAPPFVRGEVITGKGLRWLARGDGRLFLWLHYMDAHYPYVPPREFARRFCERLPNSRHLASLFSKMLEDPDLVPEEKIDLLVALYDAQINYVDACVSRIIDTVWEKGLQDDTIIVITADHGEEFREHGDFSHATSLHSRRSPKLYDELLHVPLIFYVPPRLGIKAPVIVDDLVGLLDLSPTILDLLGLELPVSWLGQSLVPIMSGPSREAKPVISGYWLDENEHGEKIDHKPVLSGRTSEWKYIYDGEREQRLLFHLATDPGERQNLYTQCLDVAASLEQIIQAHLTQIRETSEYGEDIELDKTVLERLRSLGYID